MALTSINRKRRGRETIHEPSLILCELRKCQRSIIAVGIALEVRLERLTEIWRERALQELRKEKLKGKFQN